MVIDPRHRMYHVPYPKQTPDQIRYQVRPGTGPFHEMLTFTFENVRGEAGTLVVRWGTTQVAFQIEVEPKHKLTLSEADAKPFLGTYLSRWTEAPPTAPASKVTLNYEDGMLIGHWVPAPWPEAATIVLVKIKEDWFMVGTMVNGKLTDLMDEWVFEFARTDGAVAGYEIWGDGDKPDARATRE
jgi:hypothetical protein